PFAAWLESGTIFYLRWHRQKFHHSLHLEEQTLCRRLPVPNALATHLLPRQTLAGEHATAHCDYLLRQFRHTTAALVLPRRSAIHPSPDNQRRPGKGWSQRAQ